MTNVSIQPLDSSDLITRLGSEGDAVCHISLTFASETSTVEMDLDPWLSGIPESLLDITTGIAAGVPFAPLAPEQTTMSSDTTYDAGFIPIFRAEENTLTIGIANYLDNPHDVVVEWRETEMIATQSFPLADTVADIVDLTETYLNALDERPPEHWKDRSDSLRARLRDAEKVRDHLNKSGTIAGFKLDRERAEEYLFDRTGRVTLLSHCIVETGTLEIIVTNCIHNEDQQALQQLIERDGIIRRATVTKLSRIKRPIVMEVLASTIWTDDPDVVPMALEALVNGEFNDAERVLSDAIDVSEEPTIREAAAKLLGSIASRTALKKLEYIAENDKDNAVREAAQAALRDADQ